MKRNTYQAGEVIFREGDESEEAYWIVSGRVEIGVETPQGHSVLTTLHEGEIFGEMGMIDDLPRAATATALTKTELEIIDEEAFHQEILGDEKRLMPYLATLFERLRIMAALLEAEHAKRGARRAPLPRAKPGERAILPPRRGEVGEPAAVKVVVSPTERSARLQTGKLPLTIERFPFRLGRQPENLRETAFARIDLGLADTEPFNVSRGHCLFEVRGSEVAVRDCGSRLGTIVNGRAIGAGGDEISAALQPGENTLVLGTEEGPHHYVVTVG